MVERFLYRILSTALAFSLSLHATTSNAHAAGWTQPKGSLQTITSLRYYTTDSYYDNSGNSRSQPRYTKYELNPYAEYGLTDSITLGFNGFVDIVTQNTPNSVRDSNYSLSDTELFARVRLYQSNDWVFSLQPLLKLPSVTRYNTSPRAGSKYTDAELSGQFGTHFDWFGKSHFTTLSVGYRHRFDFPKDQFKADWTTGFNLNERWQLTPHLTYTGRIGAKSNTGFTQSGQDDYNLLSLQISAKYALDERTAVELGAFSHSDGDNTGAGGGVILAWWKRF